MEGSLEEQHGFVIIDLSTTVNMEVSLTIFTYQIKLKTKQVLFSHYKIEKLLKEVESNT